MTKHKYGEYAGFHLFIKRETKRLSFKILFANFSEQKSRLIEWPILLRFVRRVLERGHMVAR